MNQDFLKEVYDYPSFKNFLESFLPDFKEDLRAINTSNTTHIKSARKLGESPELELAVYELEHEGSTDKRVGLALEGFRLMKDTGVYNALVVYKSNNENSWRLSLMTTSQELKNGRVVNAFSNPRRYSYTLGSNAKIATPTKFLISKGKVGGFEDLLSRFSVEVVNNEFYKEIAKLYDELVGTEDTSRLLVYPNSSGESHQFAVRLIGRIVFCWFLREKHSPDGIPLISKAILSREASSSDNYYHQTLAPLFFQVLNEPSQKRTQRFKVEDFGNIPYLNGGLFAPQDDDYYKFDDTLEHSVPGLVNVPDKWLRKLFDLLELYNFTVDENTSVDIDLSIDPEMLGRIFENLLARINPETGETVRKSTGSFYTPREVVEYMVDESLAQYLGRKTNLEMPKIRALISYDLNDDKEHPIDGSQAEKIVRSLGELRILDPACGSGAFPIGILQKVVFILQQVDPEAKIWFENQVANTPPELRHLIQKEFENRNFDYIRKLGVIRESIFGVDIQPIATEIARLRCFLTLIVDERVNDSENNRGVYPLPNLDFKFVTGNTLIKLTEVNKTGDEQTGLFEDRSGINELKRLRDEYFNSHNSEREVLKLKFLQAQNKMLQNMIANHSHGFSDLTQKLSTWDPFSHKSTEWFDPSWMFGIESGFDIVIGNPPYISHDAIPLDKKILKQYAVFGAFADIYCYFYEVAKNLTEPSGGIVTYITSNSFIKAEYAKQLRKLLSETTLLSLVNMDESQVFSSAIVNTSIVISRSEPRTDGEVTIVNSPYDKRISFADYIGEVGFSRHRKEFSDKPWMLVPEHFSSVVSKLVDNNKTLENLGAKIRLGLATGSNKAFVLDEAKKNELIKLDPKNAEIIKPVLGGKDIKRYGFEQSQYLLLTKNGVNVRRDYPTIYTYLESFGEEFMERGAKGQHWSNLRACAFFDDFKEEKIIWIELTNKGRFAYSDQEVYLLNSAYFMLPPKGIQAKLLLAILNSKVIQFYMNLISQTSGMGTNRWINAVVKDFPMPTISDNQSSTVNKAISVVGSLSNHPSKEETEKLEDELNQAVYALYGLDDEEIKIIEAHS